MLYNFTGSLKIFSANSNVDLANNIANELGLTLGESEVSRFNDGEISLKIFETVRRANVFIVQPISPPVNDNLMELLIMVDAMKRASAGTINAVVPYFGYARQDRKTRARDPISAKLVANLFTTAGVDRILTLDLHCEQVQGFFDIPVDNLFGRPLLTDYYIKKYPDRSNFIVVSPDLGSVARARKFAERLDVPIAIVDKRRPQANVSEIMNIVGDVQGKHVILVDDLIDTAGTITNAANALMERGAICVDACATHGLLSDPALSRIEASAISELLITDTIKLPSDKKSDKIKVISVAKFMADAIYRIHEGLSVSILFD